MVAAALLRFNWHPDGTTIAEGIVVPTALPPATRHAALHSLLQLVRCGILARGPMTEGAAAQGFTFQPRATVKHRRMKVLPTIAVSLKEPQPPTATLLLRAAPASGLSRPALCAS